MAKKVAKKATSGTARKPRAGAGAARAADESRGARTAPDPSVPLSEVLGQPGAVAIMHAAIRSGRVHHAWIFSGPEGVGKMTSARAFAALLLDPTTAPTLAGVIEPDPESRVQRLLARGAHPDLHVVRKELAESSRDAGVRGRKLITIPKEVLEEFLLEPASRTRVLTGDSLAAKVFVIDEAHLLGRESQNLLLKTLEEPPAGTVIVLVTPSEERLLPTIRSRCQRVAFTPLDDETMRTWASRAGVASGEALSPLLAMAEGSPGRLAALARTEASGWMAALEPMLAHADRGDFIVDLGPRMAELVSARAERAVEGLRSASKDAANRAAAHELFTQLAWRYRAQLRSPGLEPSALRDAAEAIDLIHLAETRLAANVQVAVVAEALAADLASRSARATARTLRA